jgi:hypothetical protein
MYTDIFPDLTEDGAREARRAIRFICKHANGLPFVFDSSPSPRAKGTTFTMINDVCHPVGFTVDPRIGDAVVFDQEVMRERFNRLLKVGSNHLSMAYETDPICEAGIAIESRSSVRARFYGYLECLFKYDFLPENGRARNKCIVCTSHYEDLFNLVKDIFTLDYEIDKPLQYGEVIMIEVYSTNLPEFFGLQAEFRGELRFVHFDCQRKEILHV